MTSAPTSQIAASHIVQARDDVATAGGDDIGIDDLGVSLRGAAGGGEGLSNSTLAAGRVAGSSRRTDQVTSDPRTTTASPRTAAA